jgi:hypothetical protein
MRRRQRECEPPHNPAGQVDAASFQEPGNRCPAEARKERPMKTIRAAVAGLALAAAILSTAAAAPHTRLYDAVPGEDTVIDLSICSPTIDIEVAGAGNTDYDFYVYDWDGYEIYANEETTDWMTGTFTQEFDGCGEYQLYVFNNGDARNRFVVRLTV